VLQYCDSSPDKFFMVNELEPDPHGVQFDRKLAEPAPRRAIKREGEGEQKKRPG
jgi:hypothetical protein